MKAKTSANPIGNDQKDPQLAEHSRNNLSHGLKLEWCLGLNYELSEGTINLTTDKTSEVCYTSGHTVVIYDFGQKRQRIFQGHPNKISAIAFNKKSGILVTADEGDTSMLIVWKIENGLPIRTIFEPEKMGIVAIDISQDGERLLTLGKSNNGVQRVRIWKWKDMAKEHPIETESVFQFQESKYPNRDPFRYIKFNQYDLTEFVATGKDELKFFRIDKSGCTSYNPNSLMRKEATREQNPEFSQTLFLPEEGGNVAVTGTEEGNLIVWDIILIMEEEGNLNHRREVKSINLFGKVNAKNPGVSLLTLYNKYLVVGTSAGTVRFYDFRFRIICWFEDLNLSRITSISFSLTHRKSTPAPKKADGSAIKEQSQTYSVAGKESGGNKPKAMAQSQISEGKTNNRNTQNETQANLIPDNEDELEFPEFIVCDVDARLTLLHKGIFQEIDPTKRQGKLILQSIDKKVLCISSSPKGHRVAIACSNSRIYEWTLGSAKLKLLKSFKDEGHTSEMPTCISYSPNGEYLVAGTSQGNIFIKAVDALQFGVTPLLISQKKKGIRCEIIRFAPDRKYFAVSDDLKCVSLFKLGHKYDDPSQPIEWVFAAKIRVHTGPINDLCFSGNSERLFSVSEDMYMAEYNVPKSKDTLYVERLEKIESEDAPNACIYYPLEKNEDMILVANAGYKLKLWNVVNHQRVCRLTCLGPTFAGPINSYCIISEDQGQIPNWSEKVDISLSEDAQKKRDNPTDRSKNDIPNPEEIEREGAKKLATSKFSNNEENPGTNTKQPLKTDPNFGNKTKTVAIAGNLNDSQTFDSAKRARPGVKTVDEKNKGLLNDKRSPQNQPKPKYLAFSTREKVIGIIKLPLDGNPNNSVAIIAHSGKINYMEASKDGKFLLTAGDNDLSLNVWKVNYDVLENSPLMSVSQETKPDLFPSLLEGGVHGQLYRDLKDFFYYCQIRRKEENTTKAHKLDGKIPLKEIPNLMISLGYYPTTREIENMQNEVKYSKLHQGIVTEDLDLETFVKLFINHRPAYGLTNEYMSDLISTVFPKGQITRKEFLHLMANYGEKLGSEPMDYFFTTLMGVQKPAEQLPETFDVKYLVENILGFEMPEEGDKVE